jgi:hypothetical protein
MGQSSESDEISAVSAKRQTKGAIAVDFSPTDVGRSQKQSGIADRLLPGAAEQDKRPGASKLCPKHCHSDGGGSASEQHPRVAVCWRSEAVAGMGQNQAVVEPTIAVDRRLAKDHLRLN